MDLLNERAKLALNQYPSNYAYIEEVRFKHQKDYFKSRDKQHLINGVNEINRRWPKKHLSMPSGKGHKIICLF